MSRKEKELEELANLKSEVEKLIKKYNHIAASGNHSSRVGLAMYIDDCDIIGDEDIDGTSIKNLLDFTNTIGVRSNLTIDGGQPDWFPSSFC